MQASNMSAQQGAASALTNIVRCQCPPPPPPLEFPENVKREMQLIDAEHRGRECELYSKIIELQIENANLKGDKEALKGILSHRDKMLVELQTQLQIMEYVCRENDVKVDIDLCPDEAFQNWSFKESDEVYQRIILTTQDMLRTGHKCIQENTVTSRSSAHNSLPRRSSWAMSNMAGSAGLGIHRGTVIHDQGAAGTQGINIQDQGSDSSVPTKKMSHQQGANKADKQRLLQLEQVFQVTGNSSSSIVSHANLAKIDAGVVENNGRRALDCGDDRSSVFRTSTDDYCYTGEDFIDEIGRSHVDSDASGDDVDGDDDDEGQESEFEELGEDMIKYVELESSVGPPRRDSRSSSFSKMGGSSPYGGVSAIGTPDMSTAVLMKNLWAHKSSNGARQSASTTPLQHPFHSQQQQQQHYSQPHFRYGATASGNTRRVSGGSSVSCSSLIDDYFMQGQQDLVDTTKITAVAGPMQHGQPTTAAPIVIGLGLSGIFPPAPLPTSSSSSSSSSFASSSPFYAPVHTATTITLQREATPARLHCPYRHYHHHRL
ncbi:hypothetical protein BGZ99_004678 [Dissophora globulifera]|uniref:Uncharacterized protein n=1 Tax=Dissophora globulifera TaxID=979702 RepID=A0A9P6RHA4_9FUNG|nr:hypothetical protein BGZ99_004678 [Dissophora globulifera]